jgi:hypothetical protein
VITYKKNSSEVMTQKKNEFRQKLVYQTPANISGKI